MVQNKKISMQDFLLNFGTYPGKTFKHRVLAFIAEQRPLVAFMGIPIVIGSATLALGHLPPLLKLVEILISVYLIVSGMHVINDTFDTKRDEKKWPMRAAPLGLIKRYELGAYAMVLGVAGVALAYYWFTWQCAFFVALVLVLGALYSKYTRDKIGYLTEIFIPALMPVGAWAAFAPETLFTGLPWALYLFMATHQIAHIVSVELHAPNTKTFVVKLSQEREPWLYVISVLAMLIVGTAIYFVASLHWIYMAALVGLTVFSLISAVPMLKNPTSIEDMRKANMTIVNYNIVYWLALAAGVIL